MAENQIASYRHLSISALAGFACGVLSICVVLHLTLFSIAAALGILFSLIGLQRTRRDADVVAGRKLAWVGLVLSVFFLVAGQVNWYATEARQYNQAEQVGNRFLTLMSENKPLLAYQITLPPSSRIVLEKGSSLTKLEQTHTLYDNYHKWLGDAKREKPTIPVGTPENIRREMEKMMADKEALESEVVVTLASKLLASRPFSYTLESSSDIRDASRDHKFFLHYRILPETGEPLTLVLEAERQVGKSATYWRIRGS